MNQSSRPNSHFPSRATFERLFGLGSDPLAQVINAPRTPARPTSRVFIAAPTGPATIVERFK